MNRSKAISILTQQTGIFRRAGPAAAELAVQRGKLEFFPMGTTIFKQGEAVKSVYFLLSGTVSSDLDGLKTSELLTGALGGATGVMMEGAKHSQTHTVESVEGADTLIIERDVFVDLIDTNKEFRNSIIVHFSNKNRKKNAILAQKFMPATPSHVTTEDNKTLSVINVAVFDAKPYDIKYLTEAFEAMEKNKGNTCGATSAGSAAAPKGCNPNATFRLKFIKSKLNSETAPLAIGCQAVCIFVNDTANAEVLQMLKGIGIQMILLRCAGFNNVDLECAVSQKMAVARVPAYSPYAVAEHAAALLLSLNRRIHTAFMRVRAGNFMLHGLQGRDLNGLTCGVFGTGKIGQVFATIASGFGMKVLLWDKFPNKAFAAKIGATYVENMDDMFPRCDVISLHLPLTPQTHHLINKHRVQQVLKKDCLLINTSRGPIVESEALVEGLVSGKIGGAGLDVYENEKEFFFEDRSYEPIKDATLARLIGMPNVIITSHQAFFTDKALSSIGEVTAHNAKEFFLQGKKAKQLTNVVLPEGYDPVTTPNGAINAAGVGAEKKSKL